MSFVIGSVFEDGYFTKGAFSKGSSTSVVVRFCMLVVDFPSFPAAFLV